MRLQRYKGIIQLKIEILNSLEEDNDEQASPIIDLIVKETKTLVMVGMNTLQSALNYNVIMILFAIRLHMANQVASILLKPKISHSTSIHLLATQIPSYY